MTLKMNSTQVEASITSLIANLYNGPTPTDVGKLVIYKGTRPASLTVDPSASDIIISFDLPRGSAGYLITTVGDNVVASLTVPARKLASAAGEASFFRLIPWGVTPHPVFEGDITDRLGSGDLKIATTNILMGIYVRILSLELTFPTIIS